MKTKEKTGNEKNKKTSWLFLLFSDFHFLRPNFYFNLVCIVGLTKLKSAFTVHKDLFCPSQTYGTDLNKIQNIDFALKGQKNQHL